MRACWCFSKSQYESHSLQPQQYSLWCCPSSTQKLRGLTQVDTISTAELLEGSWTQDTVLLVMPGGADLPYCKQLNGRGNRIIKGRTLQRGCATGGECVGACPCRGAVGSVEDPVPLRRVGLGAWSNFMPAQSTT
jgi:hypothetical protein